MIILYAGLLLGILGLIFGGVLTFAAKKFHVEVDERVEQIKDCLGGANCGACGYAGCDAFAQAVVDGKAPIDGCAPAGAKGIEKNVFYHMFNPDNGCFGGNYHRFVLWR
mgnify:CR=1 FL=1